MVLIFNIHYSLFAPLILIPPVYMSVLYCLLSRTIAIPPHPLDTIPSHHMQMHFTLKSTDQQPGPSAFITITHTQQNVRSSSLLTRNWPQILIKLQDRRLVSWLLLQPMVQKHSLLTKWLDTEIQKLRVCNATKIIIIGRADRCIFCQPFGVHVQVKWYQIENLTPAERQ